MTARGTCVSCLRPTDTGLAVRGDNDWQAAFLLNLAIPLEQAQVMTRGVPRDVVYRVCGPCVARSSAPFPAPAPMVEGQPLPTIGQPPDAIGPVQ